MMRVEVLSVKGRPKASTPITFRGTACTILVLRRLRNSELAFNAFSVIWAFDSSASSRPGSSLCIVRGTLFSLLGQFLLVRFGNLRAFRVPWSGGVSSSHGSPQFLQHPYGTDQQVDRSLEESRVVAFDAMTQQQENPATHKTGQTPTPAQQDEQNKAHEDQGDANRVENFIPDRIMLMVVLRHVVRQPGHSAPPISGSRRTFGGDIP